MTNEARIPAYRIRALSAAVGLALGGMSLTAHALHTPPRLYWLQPTDGSLVSGCPVGGTPPNCDYGITTTSVTGSWFAMDADGDGSMSLSEKTRMSFTDLIPWGIPYSYYAFTVTATGSHFGTIDGSESPAFDIWEFFCATGMHYIRSPILEVGTHTGNAAQLDFSGWTVTWNGIPAIDLGGGTQDCGTTSDGICGTGFWDVGGVLDNGSSQATITCSNASCSVGSDFTLAYQAVVPQDDPSGFGGVSYELYLEGRTGLAPIPPAAWLFGSGLVGLAVMTRRRRKTG